MKFKIFILNLFLLHTVICFSQQGRLQLVKIGDTVPDVLLKMINYKSERVKLSDFRGKLLILDFWSTWCTSCIAQFPKMERLQKMFGDKLVILPVTSFGDRKYNEDFFEKRKAKGKAINLPSAIEAKNITDTLFPANGIPQEVWIDENGVLIGVTDQYPVTENNIQQILTGGKVSLPVKEYAGKFDESIPLMTNNGDSAFNEFTYRSIITPFNPYIRGSGPYFADYGRAKKWIRICNKPIIDLFKTAIFNSISSNKDILVNDRLNKRVILNNSDSLKIKQFDSIRFKDYITREKLKRESLFCYELIIPNSYSKGEAYYKVYEDLSSFFNLNASIEKRKIRCLLLTNIVGQNNLRRASERRYELSETGVYYSKEGTSIEELINGLNNEFKEMPIIIDGTNNINKEDYFYLKLDSLKNKSLNEIRNILNKNGFDLMSEKRELSMLVLRDKNKQLFNYAENTFIRKPL